MKSFALTLLTLVSIGCGSAPQNDSVSVSESALSSVLKMGTYTKATSGYPSQYTFSCPRNGGVVYQHVSETLSYDASLGLYHMTLTPAPVSGEPTSGIACSIDMILHSPQSQTNHGDLPPNWLTGQSWVNSMYLTVTSGLCWWWQGTPFLPYVFSPTQPYPATRWLGGGHIYPTYSVDGSGHSIISTVTLFDDTNNCTYSQRTKFYAP